jgi:hypothetical protein
MTETYEKMTIKLCRKQKVSNQCFYKKVAHQTTCFNKLCNNAIKLAILTIINFRLTNN